jgi:hypothetical protein
MNSSRRRRQTDRGAGARRCLSAGRTRPVVHVSTIDNLAQTKLLTPLPLTRP